MFSGRFAIGRLFEAKGERRKAGNTKRRGGSLVFLYVNPINFE